jgi:hypothetical protein
MKNLFPITQDLYSEGLTTEVPKIILQKKEYSSHQKLFYNYLLRRHENKSTVELKFNNSL